MIVLFLVIILIILVALILYSTNNVFNILLSVFIISAIGYMVKYRYTEKDEK